MRDQKHLKSDVYIYAEYLHSKQRNATDLGAIELCIELQIVGFCVTFERSAIENLLIWQWRPKWFGADSQPTKNALGYACIVFVRAHTRNQFDRQKFDLTTGSEPRSKSLDFDWIRPYL